MAVNDKIRVVDYNAIRNTVAGVLGTSGPATLLGSTYGWGQPVNSSAVAEGTKLTVSHIQQLRNDIINAWTHIFGTAPTPAQVVEHGKVRFNASDAPVNSYQALANSIDANRFTIGSPSVNTPFPAIFTSWPGVYGSNWTSFISCEFQVSWPDAEKARHFWNSGGQIRFTASRTGGSGTTQNTQWTALLSSIGTQSFGGNNPSTGFSPPNPMDGRNWYRCTNTPQVFFTQSMTSPYGGNSYRITARTIDAVANNNATGTATQARFRVEFIDNYVDPGIAPLPSGSPNTATAAMFPPGDSVDGTFSVAVDLLFASAAPLVPLALGTFSVVLPTVTVIQQIQP